MTANVATDLPDYSPGMTAIITTWNSEEEGVNFEVGEQVKFQVTRTDGIADQPSGNLPWYVTDGEVDLPGDGDYGYFDADSDGALDYGRFPDLDGVRDGKIKTSWFVEDQYANSSLRLTATGQNFGAVATTDFTDSSVSITAPSTVTYYTTTPVSGNTISVGYSYTQTGAPGSHSLVYTAALRAAGGTTNLTSVVSVADTFTGNTTRTGTLILPVYYSGIVDGKYDLYFKAVDNSTATVETTKSNWVVVDTVAPSVSLTSPTLNPNFTTGNVTISANASDTTSGVQKVDLQYKKDTDVSWTTASSDTNSPYSTNVSVSSLTAGNYIARAVAYDNAGNSTESATEAFSVGSVSGTVDSVVVGAQTGARTYGDATGNVTYSVDATRAANGNFTGNYSVSGLPTGVSFVSFNPVAGDATGNFPLVDTTLTLQVANTVNAGSYNFTVTLGGVNGTGTLLVSKANATVVVTPYTVTYNGLPHTSTVTSITGVNGETDATVGTVDVSGTTHTNAGTYNTDYWTFDGTANYNDIAATAIVNTINKANATVVVTPYTVTYNGLPHTSTVSTINGVNGETGATVGTVNVSNTTHTNAGTYNTDYWTFTGTANYNDISAQYITDVITLNDNVTTAYIGELAFTTSSSSKTTAQVNLVASVTDKTGSALSGAKISFIQYDPVTNNDVAILAKDVPVSPVTGQPSSGTAAAIVTLSSGKYGSEMYYIRVVMTGNYTNDGQPEGSKTAEVVVTKPAATGEITGGGTIGKETTSAGLFGSSASAANAAATYSIGVKYTKSGGLQGGFSISVPQSDGSTIVVKSNSLSSMTISGKTAPDASTAVIYAKASVYRIGENGTEAIDGNVSFRVDVYDASFGVIDSVGSKIGFTAISSKTGALYYSNDWYYDTTTKSWRTRTQAVATGTLDIA